MSNEEKIETPNFKDMDIGQLRHVASHMRLPLSKTAKKEEILKAIEAKVNGKVIPEFAGVDSKVRPGYAKIMILEDPMPGAANYPVYLQCNDYSCLLPRGVELIVPQRVVRTLNDAKVKRRKQAMVSDSNGRETQRETTVISPSYPFQVLEMVPGEEPLTNLEISKRRTAGPKRRYRQLFGRWPRPKELTRAIEQKIITLNDDELLDPVAESMLGNDNA